MKQYPPFTLLELFKRNMPDECMILTGRRAYGIWHNDQACKQPNVYMECHDGKECITESTVFSDFKYDRDMIYALEEMSGDTVVTLQEWTSYWLKHLPMYKGNTFTIYRRPKLDDCVIVLHNLPFISFVLKENTVYIQGECYADLIHTEGCSDFKVHISVSNMYKNMDRLDDILCNNTEDWMVHCFNNEYFINQVYTTMWKPDHHKRAPLIDEIFENPLLSTIDVLGTTVEVKDHHRTVVADDKFILHQNGIAHGNNTSQYVAEYTLVDGFMNALTDILNKGVVTEDKHED